MRKQRVWIGLVVLAMAAAVGWYFVVRSKPAEDGAESASDGTAGAAGRSSANNPQQPTLPGSAGSNDGTKASVTLDCARPTGNVAAVDGMAITAQRVCDWLKRVGGAGAKGVDATQARLVIERMIDAMLVRRALDAANVSVSDLEVTAAVEKLGVKPASDAGVQPGPSFDVGLLHEQVRERLELQRLAEVGVKLDVTEQEVDAELAAGAPGIDRGQGIRVEGWLARMSPSADAATQAKSEQAARDFALAIGKGNPEGAAARSGLKKLPPFVVAPNGLEPDLEDGTVSLAKGQWSGPIKTKVGWMVIRMLERVEGTRLDDKALRDRVRSALETRKAAGAGKDVMTRLRNAARIEILVDL